MLYKTDWPETREWLAGWWHGEVRDHWALGIAAPRAKPLPLAEACPPVPSDHRRQWMDAEYRLAQQTHGFANTFFGGVLYPALDCGLGPGCMNLFLGSEPSFMPQTVWYNPCISDPAKANLRWDEDNFYWRWIYETTKHYHRVTKERCITVIPDLIEGLDVVSELVGTQELLTHLIDCPAEIHRLLQQVNDLYFKAFDGLYEVLRDDQKGNAFIAFNAWGPGKTLKSQCDFSAMISTEMFAEFVIPYLTEQCAKVDYATYHLDGPGALRHLPLLLEVPGLRGIQWEPGAGNPPCSDKVWWKSVWEPIYRAGKSAMVLNCPAGDMEPFLKEFGQKGTMFTTYVESEAEAQRWLDVSVNWDA